MKTDSTNIFSKIKTLAAALLLALPISAQEELRENLAATADSVAIDSVAYADSTVFQMPWDERVKSQLERFAAEADHSYYNTGICVWDLTADSLLFGYNNQKVMRPASTQKVLTAVSALSILGSKHEIRTRTFHNGFIDSNGRLNGDIYVVGDFDPMYSHNDIKELALAIKDYGIKQVSGKIYGDGSMKNSDLYGNGWCWDDVPSKYQPFLCGLMLERGTLAPKYHSYSKDPAFNPAEYFAKILSKELKEINVLPADSALDIIAYEAKAMPISGKLKTIYTQTRTIEEVMQRMMKESDNLHAEALFFQIANLNKGRYCTWKDGARQVNNVLRKAGVNTAYVEVADGSGVSLYNYVSPDAEVAMLRLAYSSESIFTTLYNSLPIAGVDGTLSKRMKTGNAYNNVRAKTGTVEGCICLCGYVTASNGHLLAFSIMNNGVLKGQTAREYQDRVCQELAR